MVHTELPTVALIAHDRKKDELVAFAQQHVELLKRYRLIATGTTGGLVHAATSLPVECKASGPLGGDAQIATECVAGHVVAVFFLIDPLYARPHEPDIQTLQRLCVVYNIPIATNLATAKALTLYLQQ